MTRGFSKKVPASEQRARAVPTGSDQAGTSSRSMGQRSEVRLVSGQ